MAVTINLPQPSFVSVGLYPKNSPSQDRLVMSGFYPAGPLTLPWDEKNDAGQAVSEADYDFQYQYNAWEIDYEFGIGSTAVDIEGDTRPHAIYSPYADVDAAVTPSRTLIALATGYNEGARSQTVINLADPGRQLSLFDNRAQPWSYFTGIVPEFIGWSCVTHVPDPSQGARLGRGVAMHFLMFVRTSDLGRVTFTNGTFAHHWETGDLISCVGLKVDDGLLSTPQGLVDSNQYEITGFCMQGTYALLSRGRQNQIEVYDLANLSGGELSTFAINSPGGICRDGAGGYWVTCENETKVQQLTMNNGALSLGSVAVTNLTAARKPAVADNKLWVALSGLEQRPVPFSLTTGQRLADAFTQNGYASSAVVDNTKFLFQYLKLVPIPGDPLGRQQIAVAEHPVGICPRPGGGIIVTDPDNNRLQFYDSQNQFVTRMAWMPAIYGSQHIFEGGNRLVSGFLQFTYDPDNPGPDNWSLDFNYSYNVRFFPSAVALFGGIREPWQHRETQHLFGNVNMNDTTEVALEPTGLRICKGIQKETDYTYFVSCGVGTNKPGSLYRCRNVDPGITPTYDEFPCLPTLDSDGDPQRGAMRRVHTGFPIAYDPDFLLQVSSGNGNRVYDDVLYLFDPSAPREYSNYTTKTPINPGDRFYKLSRGPHIVALPLSVANGNVPTAPIQLVAKAVPDGKQYIGRFPDNFMFENRGTYPGGDLFVCGPYLIWNHHGEFDPNTGQTGVLFIYHCATMLPVARFGWPGRYPYKRGYAQKEISGNAQNCSFVIIPNADGSIKKLIACWPDETWQSVIHRVSLTNIGSLVTARVPAQAYMPPALGSNLLASLPRAAAFTGAPNITAIPSDPSLSYILRTDAYVLPDTTADLYTSMRSATAAGSMYDPRGGFDIDLRKDEVTGLPRPVPRDFYIDGEYAWRFDGLNPLKSHRLEGLDSSGRVLIRVNPEQVHGPDGDYTGLSVNGQPLFTRADFDYPAAADAIVGTLSKMPVWRVGNQLAIKHEAFPHMLLVDPLNPLANLDGLARWKMLVFSGGGNLQSDSSVHALQLRGPESSIVKQAATVLSQPDANKQLVAQASAEQLAHYNAGKQLLWQQVVTVNGQPQPVAGPWVAVQKVLPTPTYAAQAVAFTNYITSSGTNVGQIESSPGVIAGFIFGRMGQPLAGGIQLMFTVDVVDVIHSFRFAISSTNDPFETSDDYLIISQSSDYTGYGLSTGGGFFANQELAYGFSKQVGDKLRIVLTQHNDGTCDLRGQLLRGGNVYSNPGVAPLPVSAAKVLKLFGRVEGNSVLAHPTTQQF